VREADQRRRKNLRATPREERRGEKWREDERRGFGRSPTLCDQEEIRGGKTDWPTLAR